MDFDQQSQFPPTPFLSLVFKGNIGFRISSPVLFRPSHAHLAACVYVTDVPYFMHIWYVVRGYHRNKE